MGMNFGGLSGSATPTNPVGGLVGGVVDMASSFIPNRSEYQGDKGAITQGMDAAYDKVSDAVMAIPPWGTIAGIAMKGNKLLNKAIGRLGGSTDGMTTVDAVLGSSFLAPIGWINGFTGKKADTMKRDEETWAAMAGSYGGSSADNDLAMSKLGKKYGGFSNKARKNANALIHEAGRDLNMLKTISLNYAMNLEAGLSQNDMLSNAYNIRLRGGIDNSAIHSAKLGGIMFTTDLIRKAKTIAFAKKGALLALQDLPEVDYTFVYNPKIFEENESDIEKFQNGGLMNVIPEGALHARKHNMDESKIEADITHKGIPVVSITKDGEKSEQVCEIEKNEILVNLLLTKLLEELRDKYNKAEKLSEKDLIAIEAGMLFTEDLINNTDDRTGLFDDISEFKNGGTIN